MNFERAQLRERTDSHPTDWVSSCPVCEGRFVIDSKDSPENPAPHGCFCPDCRASKLIAPGVLHWKHRGVNG